MLLALTRFTAECITAARITAEQTLTALVITPIIRRTMGTFIQGPESVRTTLSTRQEPLCAAITELHRQLPPVQALAGDG